jgi:hypothetical protein
MSSGAKLNLVINAAIGLGFIFSAISGIYFLFLPRGMSALSSQADGLLFPIAIWDFIHTWSSVIMILAATAHFIIHWGWIEKVTKGFFGIRTSLVVGKRG